MKRIVIPKITQLKQDLSENASGGRFYRTHNQDHHPMETLVSLLSTSAHSDSMKNEIISVDRSGIANITNFDTAAPNAINFDMLQGEAKVKCATYSHSEKLLFVGCFDGTVWSSNFEQTEQLAYTHKGAVLAIATAFLAVITAGEDKKIIMFNIKSGKILREMSSSSYVHHVYILSLIRGTPVVLGDDYGCISVWSPRRPKNANIQICGRTNENICCLGEIRLFQHTCLTILTKEHLRVWSISAIAKDVEVLSVLSEAMYYAVRTMQAPAGVHFTSAATTVGTSPLICTALSDCSAILWEPISRSPIRRFTNITLGLHVLNTHMQYLAGEGLWVFGDANCGITVFDPQATSCILRTEAIPKNTSITSVAMVEDVGLVVVGDSAGQVTVFVRGSKSHAFDANADKSPVSTLAVCGRSATSILLFVACTDGMVLTYTYDFKECAPPTLTERVVNQYTLRNLRFFDSRRLLGVDTQGTISVWNLADERLQKQMDIGDSYGTADMVVIASDEILVTGHASGEIIIWDSLLWQSIGVLQLTHAAGVASVGYYYDPCLARKFIISCGDTDNTVKIWDLATESLHRSFLLPLDSIATSLWSHGSSPILYVQTSDRNFCAIDVFRHEAGPLRHFSRLSAKSQWFIAGHGAPYVICTSRSNRYVEVWNNDVNDIYQLSKNNMHDAFKHSCMEHEVNEWLDRAIVTHPSYPHCLLEPDPSDGGLTIFGQAILAGFPNLLRKYLSKVPAAVTQSYLIGNKARSLLWLALQRNDMESVEYILDAWRMVLMDSNTDLEASTWNASELFVDITLLSVCLPARCAAFISSLALLKAHPITMKGCNTKVGDGCELWMRGSCWRTIPSFWEYVMHAYPSVSETEYDDLTKRVEMLHLTSPHLNVDLHSQFVPVIGGAPQLNRGFDVSKLSLSPRLRSSFKSKLLSHRQLSSVSQPVLAKGESFKSMAAEDHPYLITGTHESENNYGIPVEGYIHPIPHAAAGIDFLQLCVSCRSYAADDSDVLSSPLVATVLDYKWNTGSRFHHYNAAANNIFSLALFTLIAVYFDVLVTSSNTTGMPVLAGIVTIVLIVNYFISLMDELIFNVLRHGFYHMLFDGWFLWGVGAYGMALCGLIMTFVEYHSSFDSRCILAGAAFMLYIKAAHFLMPIPLLGPLVCRVFSTFRRSVQYYALLGLALSGFALSFNLLHHRRYIDFDSYFGSFLRVYSLMQGGFDSTETISDADSSLYTSAYYVVFVWFIPLFMLVVLIAVIVEAFAHANAESISLWREHQAIVILKLHRAMSEYDRNIPFHNPKWLNILQPADKNLYAPSGGSAKCDVCSVCHDDKLTKEVNEINLETQNVKTLVNVCKRSTTDRVAAAENTIMAGLDRLSKELARVHERSPRELPPVTVRKIESPAAPKPVEIQRFRKVKIPPSSPLYKKMHSKSQQEY